MIKIEEPSILGRICVCCCSEEDVLEIHVRKEDNKGLGSGVGFSLCSKCREELIRKIRETELLKNHLPCIDCLCRVCGKSLIENTCQGCDGCTGVIETEDDCTGPGFKLDEDYDKE